MSYTYICIRDYLDIIIVKRGNVYYHEIKSDLISGYKYIINNKIRDYELCALISLNGVDNIDCKCNPLKPSDDQLKEWNSSFDTFIASNNLYNFNNINNQLHYVIDINNVCIISMHIRSIRANVTLISYFLIDNKNKYYLI